MSEAQSLVEKIAEVVQLHTNASQVYGAPVERDGTTIIPVAKVQWGFGGGAMGAGTSERGGGGGGGREVPAGYIEVRNGSAEFRPVTNGDMQLYLAAGVAGLVVGLFLGRLSR